jgi:hypothetical protein
MNPINLHPQTLDQLRLSLTRELNPQTVLEQVFANEIILAAWRLHRLAEQEQTEPDDASQERIDRARSRANTIIRRASAELRRLQTDRQLRPQMQMSDAGLASPKEIATTGLRLRKLKGLHTFEALLNREALLRHSETRPAQPCDTLTPDKPICNTASPS